MQVGLKMYLKNGIRRSTSVLGTLPVTSHSHGTFLLSNPIGGSLGKTHGGFFPLGLEITVCCLQKRLFPSKKEAERLFPTDRNFSIPVALPWPHKLAASSRNPKVEIIEGNLEGTLHPKIHSFFRYLTIWIILELPTIGGSVKCEFSGSWDLEEDLTFC